MILLPSNTTDFKVLAGKVVDEHVGTGKSLEDCIVDASLQKELTPEEIRRLVEKSNTELSLRHLRGENKKENFALAKYEDVLKRTHGDLDSDEDDDDEVEKTASLRKTAGRKFSIPHTRKYAAQNVVLPGSGITKQASSTPREFNSAEYYALKAEYERAKFEKAAAEFRIQENLGWLVNSMRRASGDELTKFASDAAYGYRGQRPHVLLKHIGEACGKGDLCKYANERPVVVDNTTEAMKRLDSVYRDIEFFKKKAEEVGAFEIVLGASEGAFKRMRIGK